MSSSPFPRQSLLRSLHNKLTKRLSYNNDEAEHLISCLLPSSSASGGFTSHFVPTLKVGVILCGSWILDLIVRKFFGVVVMGALVRVFEGREEVGTKEMKEE